MSGMDGKKIRKKRSNPFASFSASKSKTVSSSSSSTPPSSNSDWMTVRKTGRDDSAIKRASIEAGDAKRDRNRQRMGIVGKGSKAAPKSKSKSKSKSNDWSESESEASFRASTDDDESDEDGFIVNSDEDEDDGGVSSDGLPSDEGDWEDSPKPPPKKHTTSKHSSTAREALKSSKRASEKLRKERKDRTAAKSKEKSVGGGSRSSRYFNDGGDSGGLDDTPVKHATVQRPKKKESGRDSDMEMDSDEALAFAHAMKSSLKDNNNKKKKESVANQKKKRRIIVDSDSDDSDESNGALDEQHQQQQPPSRKKKQTVDKRVPKLATKKKNKPVILDDDDDDSFIHDDENNGAKEDPVDLLDGDDEEEASAESESEEEQDDDDDEIDAYDATDEGEMVALDVLREANRLSANIFKTVGGWCGGGGATPSSSSKKGKKTNAGDGALDLSGISSGGGGGGTTTGDNNEHAGFKKLIVSAETMRRILPQTTLSEYQLLGVNWMALLNRSTFGGKDDDGKSGNDKKGGKDGKGGGTNVNGILADEMGLGKTVQTIAFLAWLKDRDEQKDGAAGGKPTNKKSGGGRTGGDAIDMIGEEEKKEQSQSEVDDDDEEEEEFGGGGTPKKHTTPTKSNSKRSRPHLIVVPASVLTNWMNEFKKFAPEMAVVKYHGGMKERTEIQARLRRSLPSNGESSGGPWRKGHGAEPEPLDAVLTTFSYFSMEKSTDRSFLRKFKFDYLVVDEGHTLKNPKGARYRNLDKFVTSHRLLLTGTPVQNSPKELMSLLCFLMPLFTRKTKSKSSKSNRGGDSDDEGNDGGERMLEHFVHLEGGGGDDDERAYRRLRQLFAPFVLRRRKCEVLGQILPPKTRKLDLVPLEDSSRIVYENLLSSHLKRREERNSKIAKAKTVELGNAPPEKKESDAAAQKNLFTSLRKAANHPLLLRTRYLDRASVNNLSHLLFTHGYFGQDATCTLTLVKQELESFSDYDIHCAASVLIDEDPSRRQFLERYTLVEEDMFCSAKFVRLRALLPELVGKGHRILLFSQWTRIMDLMNNLMQSMNLRFLRLDGTTPVSERQALIDEFNEDPAIPIFLLSTRAGGMGLNLTAADVCILHDLDFNPFNDQQAEDRCHRIGQRKKVTIIKMVTKDTVDEDIYSIQERKAKMNAALLETGEGVGQIGKKPKGGDAEEISSILEKNMNRFLKSPKKTASGVISKS